MRRRGTRTYVVVRGVAAALLGGIGTGVASASVARTAIVEDALRVTGERSGDVNMVLTLHRTSPGCREAQDLILVVRDAQGAYLDLPDVPGAVVCDRPVGGGRQSFAWARHLEPGTYSVFAAFRERGTWVGLPLQRTMTVGPVRLPTPSPAPAPGPG